jgi:hypothetical protein
LKNRQKWPQLPSKRNCASDFLLSYFENRQIWLNELEDARHLSNVNNLGEKKKKNSVLNFEFRFSGEISPIKKKKVVT